jgi:hypothetical protein
MSEISSELSMYSTLTIDLDEKNNGHVVAKHIDVFRDHLCWQKQKEH